MFAMIVTNIKMIRTIPKGFELIWRSLYYFIAVVLLFSGVTKIVDPIPMMETMKAVFKVNENLLILAATILPVIEIVLGLMLIFNKQTKKTLFAATILFFCFFAFSIYGTIIGLNNDCGCFGDIVESEFSIFMVLRNSMFFIIAVLSIKSFNVTAEALINK
ncbi:DoxX family membrane protein [Candidatus Gracilibacteria bacterium]|nr:DoxX family membrane protein [Candidatus Gracilibacteria bacterium]